VLDLNSRRALVPGSDKPLEVTMMKVKAVQRFWYESNMVEPGDVVDVVDSVGREVLTSGKAVLAGDSPPASSRRRRKPKRKSK